MPLPKPRTSTELYLAAILDELRAQRPAELSQHVEMIDFDAGQVRLKEPATPGGQAARPETCAGKTALGRRCRREPARDSMFCSTHGPDDA